MTTLLKYYIWDVCQNVRLFIHILHFCKSMSDYIIWRADFATMFDTPALVGHAVVFLVLRAGLNKR